MKNQCQLKDYDHSRVYFITKGFIFVNIQRAYRTNLGKTRFLTRFFDVFYTSNFMNTEYFLMLFFTLMQQDYKRSKDDKKDFHT